MSASININLKHRSYLREPENTELGRKIISEGISMIDRLGFESFTFKKLAAEIGSTEASVYRYFENKHKLLSYLVSWYWAWVDYSITYQTHNIEEPRQRMVRALEVLTKALEDDDPQVAYIDERILYRIVVAESSKVYHTKDVDAENKEGFFLEIKRVCHNLAMMVLAINPDYKYPHSLSSTIMEAAHQQLYFAQHLPSLTEIRTSKKSKEEMTSFLSHLLFSAIEHTNTASA